jgi:glycosyltransferase involved in cell wall biosynthesis
MIRSTDPETSAGVAVVASRGTVYDRFCDDGCGIPADGADERAEALELVIRDGDERAAMVARAQDKLERDYGIATLRAQVLELLAAAHVKRGRPASTRAAALSRSQSARAVS